MKLGFYFFVALLALMTGVALAGIAHTPVDRMPARNLPVQVGIDAPADNLPYVPTRPPFASGALDSVGTGYVAGTTYWDLQHNGSVGKMIGTDSLGYVHMVWRKVEDNLLLTRNVDYNCWDPAISGFVTLSGSTEGVAVNSSPLAGYTTLAVMPSGWAFPAYHERLNGETTMHASAAMDFQRRFGAFISSQPGRCNENGAPIEIVWPKVAVNSSGILHLASTESPASGELGAWQRMYYSRGVPVWLGDQGLGIEWDSLECGGFELIDTVMVISQVVCASKISDRVAIVWSHSRDNLLDTNRTQYNNDLYYKISEDGGLNWGPSINITNFIPPLDTLPQVWDDSLQQFVDDSLTADQDTNRVYTDCDAIFDSGDRLHVAFTTLNFWSWEGTISRFNSDIWHWSEWQTDEISHLAGMRFKSTSDTTIEACWPLGNDWDLGDWQRMTQRPSLAADWQTGYLYCAYQWYDPVQVTTDGKPMADILLSVSRDGGRSWTDSVNITSSGLPVDTFCNPAQVGEALSERDMSIAEQVTYYDGVGYLHMLYELDTGCGEDADLHSLNYAIYRRIPVDDIPERPMHDPCHIPFHCDSSMFPYDVCGTAVDPSPTALRPESFRLYQNYPNPFNPVTRIQFDLAREARVTLNVFNVLGQKVATLYDGMRLSAGSQTVTFDASTMASGVYIYRIEADGLSQSRKMVLLK